MILTSAVTGITASTIMKILNNPFPIGFSIQVRSYLLPLNRLQKYQDVHSAVFACPISAHQQHNNTPSYHPKYPPNNSSSTGILLPL